MASIATIVEWTAEAGWNSAPEQQGDLYHLQCHGRQKTCRQQGVHFTGEYWHFANKWRRLWSLNMPFALCFMLKVDQCESIASDRYQQAVDPRKTLVVGLHGDAKTGHLDPDNRIG